MAKRFKEIICSEVGSGLDVWCEPEIARKIVAIKGVDMVRKPYTYSNLYYVFVDARYKRADIIKEIEALA